MKNIALIFLTLLATSCKVSLPQEIFLKYRDEKVMINIALNKSDLSRKNYFGIMRVANLSDKEIELPDWERKICLRNDKKSYRVNLDYGYLTNSIASDFIRLVPAGEFFEHKVIVAVEGDFDLENLRILLSKSFFKDASENFLDRVNFCRQ